MKLEFSRYIFEKSLVSNFMQIRQLRAETDRHEANSRFSQFCERFQKILPHSRKSRFELIASFEESKTRALPSVGPYHILHVISREQVSLFLS